MYFCVYSSCSCHYLLHLTDFLLYFWYFYFRIFFTSFQQNHECVSFILTVCIYVWNKHELVRHQEQRYQEGLDCMKFRSTLSESMLKWMKECWKPKQCLWNVNKTYFSLHSVRFGILSIAVGKETIWVHRVISKSPLWRNCILENNTVFYLFGIITR